MSHDPTQLPPGLPVPLDDGACDHLGREPFNRLPPVRLPCTDGSAIDLSTVSREPDAPTTVLFFYPRTGVPGQPPSRGFSGEDWDEIPGARGCTPQSCAFRDRYDEFRALGVGVFGVSTNTIEHQREFKSRMKIPFEFLSDWELRLAGALRLPTFTFPVESGGPGTLIRRMAMVVASGLIVKVWYPVFPPDANASAVLHWLRRRGDAPAAISRGSSPGIRPIEPRDRDWVRAELIRNWGASQITSLGRWYDADALPGFIATIGDETARVGLLTHTPLTGAVRGGNCEIITLSACVENSGVGSALLGAAVNAARGAGCARIFLTTTNDNLRALGFYQRRGWRIAAVHPGAMDRARAAAPVIPAIGHHGIPLRDEIELEIRFAERPSDQ